MDLKKIKQFIDLAKSESVSELKYESKDEKISVSFVTQNSALAFHHPVAPQVNENSKKSIEVQEGFHAIKAPFVGTFYSSAAPGEPSYVKVGDKVTKGQRLCILEAMKIMNEIESDINGEIVEVCVENESYVEFGQVLFKIRK